MHRVGLAPVQEILFESGELAGVHRLVFTARSCARVVARAACISLPRVCPICRVKKRRRSKIAIMNGLGREFFCCNSLNIPKVTSVWWGGDFCESDAANEVLVVVAAAVLHNPSCSAGSLRSARPEDPQHLPKTGSSPWVQCGGGMRRSRSKRSWTKGDALSNYARGCCIHHLYFGND